MNGLSGNISSRLAIQPTVSSQRFGVASGVPSFGDATSTARPSLNRLPAVAELLRTLDEVAKDETAAGMRDDVERRGLLRAGLEQHPGVLFRRSAEAEVIEREHAIAIRACDTLEKSDAASGRNAAAAFENVPWMSSSERSGETGVAESSAPAASVSLVTLSHPSLRPCFFHDAFSYASASFGSARLTALSAPSLTTSTTIALIA